MPDPKLQALKITPEQIDTYFAARQQMNLVMRRFPMPTARSRAVISRLMDYAHEHPLEENDHIVFRISNELGLSPTVVKQLIADYLKNPKKSPRNFN